VQARVRGLATRLKARLSDIKGVRLRTPQSPGLSAGLVCFEVAGRDPSDVVARLASRGIVASVTPYATRYVRLGPGIVNTPEHVDAAVRAIRAL
jgi:isopenicillin-N epimerase